MYPLHNIRLPRQTKPQFCKIAGYCTYTPAVGCVHDNYRTKFWGILQRRAGVLGFRVHGVSNLLVRNQTRPLTRSWPALASRSVGRSLVLLSPRFNCLCFFCKSAVQCTYGGGQWYDACDNRKVRERDLTVKLETQVAR